MENDTISRQAAIAEIARWIGYIDEDMINRIQIGLNRLPSAQTDIIRCKECKYAEHWYRDKAMCFLWHETGIDVFNDGFCNYAGRRTDEAD